MPVRSPTGAKAVARAAAYLRTHADETVALPDLAVLAGLSPSHLQRAFTAHTGVSPREFQAACRAERFRESLRQGRDVTTATYEAGYGSPSRVSAHRPTGSGLSPAAYRRRGEGVAIGYAVVPCSLGRLLVAATPTGVCAVRLGSDDRPLVDELRREFPKAEVSESAPPAAWTQAIARAVDGAPGAVPGVPLDVQGTAFQWRVWKALQAIPAGQTRTYAEVAAAVGPTRGGAGGGERLRPQPGGGGGAVPPGGAQGGWHRRLSLGRCSQARPARP